MQDAVEGVAQAFIAKQQPDPRLAADGKSVFLLQRQWKGYRNNDPGNKHQKYLPLDLISKMDMRTAETQVMIVFHQLSLFGFFFAMRSCANDKVSSDRRTHLIRKRNIAFIKHRKILSQDAPNLDLADTVKTRRAQRLRHPEPQRRPRSMLIVRRLQAMGVNDDAFVYTYESDTRHDKYVDLTGPVALQLLRK
jgi:hypothetical protein